MYKKVDNTALMVHNKRTKENTYEYIGVKNGRPSSLCL